MDGFVGLLKGKPSSTGATDHITKIRDMNVTRAKYGVTKIDPARNWDEELATKKGEFALIAEAAFSNL